MLESSLFSKKLQSRLKVLKFGWAFIRGYFLDLLDVLLSIFFYNRSFCLIRLCFHFDKIYANMNIQPSTQSHFGLVLRKYNWNNYCNYHTTCFLLLLKFVICRNQSIFSGYGQRLESKIQDFYFFTDSCQQGLFRINFKLSFFVDKWSL